METVASECLKRHSEELKRWETTWEIVSECSSIEGDFEASPSEEDAHQVYASSHITNPFLHLRKIERKA